jgi:anti-sigma factor (TIGR02949 family)
MTKREIECEQALRQVFEYIDHVLDDTERAAMEHHLHTCHSCYSRVQFEGRLKAKLGELKKDDADSTLRERIKRLLESFSGSPTKTGGS